MKLGSAKKSGKSKSNDNVESLLDCVTSTQLTFSHGPPIRRNHAVCKHKNFVYLYGGQGQHKILKDFWKFDIEKQCWIEGKIEGNTLKPPALKGHSIVQYKEDLYMFGGETSFAYAREVPLWKFSTQREDWNKFSSTKSVISNRRGHVCVVYDGKMYVHGGYVDLKGPTNEMWMYDFKKDVWELVKIALKRRSPVARYKHSAVVYRHAMWMCGGLTGIGANNNFQIWSWEFLSCTWTNIRASGAPSTLYDHSVCIAENDLYIFGGSKVGKKNFKLWKTSLDKSYRFYKSTQNWKVCCHVNKTSPLLPENSCMVPIIGTDSVNKNYQDKKTSKLNSNDCAKMQETLNSNQFLPQPKAADDNALSCNEKFDRREAKALEFDSDYYVMSRTTYSPTTRETPFTSIKLNLPLEDNVLHPNRNKKKQFYFPVEPINDIINNNFTNPGEDCNEESFLVDDKICLIHSENIFNVNAARDLAKPRDIKDLTRGNPIQVLAHDDTFSYDTASDLSVDDHFIACGEKIKLLPGKLKGTLKKKAKTGDHFDSKHMIANDLNKKDFRSDTDSLLVLSLPKQHKMRQKTQNHMLQQANLPPAYMYFTRKIPQKIKQWTTSLSSVFESEHFDELDNVSTESECCSTHSMNTRTIFSKRCSPSEINSDDSVSNSKLSGVSQKVSLLFFGGKKEDAYCLTKACASVWKYEF